MTRICRFQNRNGEVRIGMVAGESTLLDLTTVEITQLQPLLEDSQAAERLIAGRDLPRLNLRDVKLCAPVERQEVWAAGVTYLRSKTARMEESNFSATAYDRVYAAERPELFFKALAEKVAGPDEPVGIRRDARWSVPEPELALVLNSRGEVAACTIGNDMSSRDIEGQNLLYLPQAKIYERSCALGPWLVLGASETEVRTWRVELQIRRNAQVVFRGETSIGQIKRSFSELTEYLFRSQRFPNGAVLLTGTGVVPPDSFTLEADDTIEIGISGIGTLPNKVIVV